MTNGFVTKSSNLLLTRVLRRLVSLPRDIAWTLYVHSVMTSTSTYISSLGVALPRKRYIWSNAVHLYVCINMWHEQYAPHNQRCLCLFVPCLSRVGVQPVWTYLWRLKAIWSARPGFTDANVLTSAENSTASFVVWPGVLYGYPSKVLGSWLDPANQTPAWGRNLSKQCANQRIHLAYAILIGLWLKTYVYISNLRNTRHRRRM